MKNGNESSSVSAICLFIAALLILSVQYLDQNFEAAPKMNEALKTLNYDNWAKKRDGER